MALIKYKYDASDTIIYQTDLYGGVDADIISATPVFSLVIDQSENMWTNFQFKVDPSASTVPLKLELFRSLTNTFDGDEVHVLQLNSFQSATEIILSFMLTPSYGPGFYRWGFSRSSVVSFDLDARYRQSHMEKI
jgi:hypothetical protein